MSVLSKLHKDVLNDELIISEQMDRELFNVYLSGLYNKLLKINTKEAKEQIEIIEKMQNSLKVQQYNLVLQSVQAKLIRELNIQLKALEIKNKDLEKENNNLKENI